MAFHPWTRWQRLRFIFAYAWAKVRLMYDVRTPKWAFLWFEFRYSFGNLLNTIRGGTRDPVMFKGHGEVETRFEVFKIRPDTQDAAIISPAFERSDLQHLFACARTSRGPVDFIDVGANIGQFCVRLAKRCPGVDLRSWAFEPVPNNFSLLTENLARNAVRDVRTFPVALSDHEGEMHMRFDEAQSGDSSLIAAPTATSITVEVGRGDQWLRDLRPNSVRIVKIDVEGHEVAVLRGLRATLATGVATEMCIEDIFNRDELHAELLAQGFTFDRKLTPYNSWYRKAARA